MTGEEGEVRRGVALPGVDRRGNDRPSDDGRRDDVSVLRSFNDDRRCWQMIFQILDQLGRRSSAIRQLDLH